MDLSVTAGLPLHLPGRPAMALTSTNFRDMCVSITHTERDTLDVVAADLVASAAAFVPDLVASLPTDA
jgi:hypothetical protein